MLPPAPGIIRARIGMVTTLRTAGRSRPKKFGFYEEDTLLRDPILYIEYLAFADIEELSRKPCATSAFHLTRAA